MPNNQSAPQPSRLSHKHPSHALGSLASSTVQGLLKTEVEALKWAGLWMASPAFDTVVFSLSFSFNEDIYRVLHSDLHKTCKSLAFLSLQLLIKSDSSQVDAHTQTQARTHSASDPFPQKSSLKLACLQLGSVGCSSRQHRDERRWRKSELGAPCRRLAGWRGCVGGDVGRGGWGNMNERPTSPSKIPFTCSHAQTQR